MIDDNVMPIYNVAEWQGVPYLVTQYSGGVTLQKRIQQQGPLELKEILRIGMQTARALAAAHAQGLVHRDVKPSNILLDGTVERAMLTDFGLARAVDDSSITRTGIIAGTPQYMSPEQACSGSVDARSDLFSLGSVLYAMCTGRPPFRADNSYAILRLITDTEPRSIREINPEIPLWLCSIIAKLMSKQADDRYQSAGEVGKLLEDCLAYVQQPNVVPLPAALVSSVTVRSCFNLSRIGVIAMVSTFGVLLSGLLLMQLPGAPDKASTPAASTPAASTPAASTPESQGKQLGTVLGKPVYENEFNKNVELIQNLETLFLRPVVEHYLTEQKIDPAADLAKRIPNEGMRAPALLMIRHRVLQKHLYDKSGGRVLLTPFGPIAYDAYKQWLTEREKAGDFKIADPEHRKVLFAKWDQDTNPKLTSSPQAIKEAFDPATTDRFIEAMARTPAGAIGNPTVRLIGEVLGQNLHLDQKALADQNQLPGVLRYLIVPKLEENYRKLHPEIEPSVAEIDVIHARFKAGEADAKFVFQEALDEVEKQLKNTNPNSDEFKELQAQQQGIKRKLELGDSRPIATTLARARKFQQHLYAHFGGGRAFETNQGIVEAFDAQKKWVEDQERLGAFQIADPSVRESFYKHWAAGPRQKGERLVEDLEESKKLLNGSAASQGK